MNSTLISDQSEAHSSISLRLSVPSDRPPLFGGGIRGDASERRLCRHRLTVSHGGGSHGIEDRGQEHSERTSRRSCRRTRRCPRLVAFRAPAPVAMISGDHAENEREARHENRPQAQAGGFDRSVRRPSCQGDVPAAAWQIATISTAFFTLRCPPSTTKPICVKMLLSM